jgi:hypothetical protein
LKSQALESTALPYSREFRLRDRLTIGGTQRAVQVLVSMELVEKDPEGRHRLTDRITSAWLA